MKYLIPILILMPLLGKANLRDTVPSGVPQLFGSKYYKFNGYILIDSFIMNSAGDTNSIPYYPSLKFKSSDKRWYGYDLTKWQRFLYASDTNTLLATKTDITNNVITANNGLTKTLNNIQLGGPLTKNTSITSSTPSFRLSLSGNNTSSDGALFDVTTSGNLGYAIRGETTNGRGLSGVATSGSAVYSSTSSEGLLFEGVSAPVSTNTVIPVMSLTRSAQTGASNGIGGRIDMYLHTTTTDRRTNQLIYKLSDATDATYTSALEIWNSNNAVLGRKALLAGTGQWTWDGYPSLTAQTDTSSYKPIGIDGSGNVVKMSAWLGSGGTGTVSQVNTGYGLLGGPITTTGTARLDTNTVDKRYERVYSITETRFAGGAVADGVENRTASMTNGSPTLTCTTCGFTSADVGKWIRVYRAGSSGQDMVTTITGFTNSTTVTLNTSASATVTGDTVIYGTDNVPAIQAALDFANAQGGDARVVIPPPGFGRFYVLAGTLNHSGSDCNCQINFPVSDISDTSFNNRKNIILDGIVGPNYTPSALFADSATPKMNTTLVSIIHGSGIRPSVFAAKANSFLYANYINYNLVTVKNLALLVEQNRAGGGPDLGGFNFYNASSSPMENILVSWNGPIHNTTQPTNEVAGIIAGQLSSEIYTTLKNVDVFGFKYGIVITESVSLDHVIAHACVNGITLIHGNYPVVAGYVDAHWCKNSVYVPQSTILGDINPGLVYFNFQNLALEVFQGSGLGAPAWLDYTYIISDSASYGRGNIYGYTLGHAEVGIDNSMFNKFGGDSIFVYQTGSAFDGNNHIYGGLTKYAGAQNGGRTNYWYNWSPIADASIMRLAPVSNGSQGLYISPFGTGGIGLPKSWITLYNIPLWTGTNTTSSNNEYLQIAANGTSGYNIASYAEGTGTVRDISIGNSTNTNQLKVAANGTTSINNTAVDDALVINGNSTNRVSLVVNNSNAVGSSSFYIQNDRSSFLSYGGMLIGGSTDPASNLFGLSRPDRTFLIHAGDNGLGMAIGTLNAQPLVFGTNNTENTRITTSGALLINRTSAISSEMLSVNGKINANADSVSTATGGYVFRDATTGEFKIAPAGGISSINSQTGSSQTIAAGTGISVNSSSNTHTISFDADYITSGTYTPTLFNVSNVSSSTAYQCQYMRIGSVITVSGKIDIQPTSATVTTIGISLPIASSFTNDYQAGGTASPGNELFAGSIKADATNDRAQLDFSIPATGTTSTSSWFFTFTYHRL